MGNQDKQPTPEEKEKFLEWCGITLIPHTDRYSSGYQSWIEYQKDGVRIDEPKLDLNNLFKYAFDKAVDKIKSDGNFRERHRALQILLEYWAEAILEYGDKTLALFWTIREVIHG